MLLGMIVGDVAVSSGTVLQMNGMIIGNLNISGGRITLNGSVNGDVTNNGGNLQINGMVNGTVRRISGTTGVDPRAVISKGLS